MYMDFLKTISCVTDKGVNNQPIKMTMTMAMTNILLNINAYSDSVNYLLKQSICKKIILNHSTNLCPETIIETKTTLESI